MTEYIIIGDTEKYEGCLVTVVHGTRERAEERLEQMLTAPTANDKILMEGHTNFRIKDVEEKDQWWNDPFLAN